MPYLTKHNGPNHIQTHHHHVVFNHAANVLSVSLTCFTMLPMMLHMRGGNGCKLNAQSLFFEIVVAGVCVFMCACLTVLYSPLIESWWSEDYIQVLKTGNHWKNLLNIKSLSCKVWVRRWLHAAWRRRRKRRNSSQWEANCTLRSWYMLLRGPSNFTPHAHDPIASSCVTANLFKTLLPVQVELALVIQLLIKLCWIHFSCGEHIAEPVWSRCGLTVILQNWVEWIESMF